MQKLNCTRLKEWGQDFPLIPENSEPFLSLVGESAAKLAAGSVGLPKSGCRVNSRRILPGQRRGCGYVYGSLDLK